MPPYVPRKRSRSPPTIDRLSNGNQSGKGKSKATAATSRKRKSTVFDDLEAGSKSRSAEKTKSALQQMHDDDDSSSLSSLSSISDPEFEDVPLAKRQKLDDEEEDEEDDDTFEFEDVPSYTPLPDPVPTGDLELTLYQDNVVPTSMDLGKKGPSKRAKRIRIATHCMHVQFLLWHNAIRNSWLCDEEVQAIMISHLPPRIWDEVDRWRRYSGLDVQAQEEVPKNASKGKSRSKAKGKQKVEKPARDWSNAADRLEKGVADMSHGDPLFRLMKALSSWWKQRFHITAPGCRKLGYMSAQQLGKLREAWSETWKTDQDEPEKYGERIKGLEEFRGHAQTCEGSRDVGAQLFTALLRGIGLEARMIANLQCVGFGWNKNEEAGKEGTDNEVQTNGTTSSTPTSGRKKPAIKKKTPVRPSSRRTRRDDRDALKMDLDDSDEYAEPISDESDDASIIDVTDEHRKSKLPKKLYDKDLEFPHYWTEVLSPITHRYLPVDPIVKSMVGTNRELVESLEPRGSKADKAKQVLAYVVGYSPDCTAKDVTVRYLRKQLFPGRTKGVRMPLEKVPIYNKHGKVKRYDQFDWFRSAMRGYSRGDQRHPITEVDELENSTDLKPAVPEKKEVKEGEETLQYYKGSKEFVLARHLKREEALLPSAKPVKVFHNKIKGGRVEDEDVYLRKDVVQVKSAETWHKQGRAPIDGVEPLKHAPYRAATTNRRREIAEAEARTGEKVLQPLYSYEQTDWIIPDPIKNGVIPKNEYGNIDMFAEHMCPEGAVHVPYKGTVRVCKRLGVDYAEAVVGFEFGHRMAVPVIQGVVIAEENYERLMEELEKDEAERARKEDEKRRKAALGMWRKLLMCMRVRYEIQRDYAYLDDEEKKDTQQDFQAMQAKDEDMAGGFLPDGYEEEEVEQHEWRRSSYFPVAHSDDEDEDDHPLQIEDGNQSRSDRPVAEALPESAQVDGEEEEKGDEEAEASEKGENETRPAPRPRRRVAKPKAKAKPKISTRRRARRKGVETSTEDDDDDDDDFELSDGDE